MTRRELDFVLHEGLAALRRTWRGAALAAGMTAVAIFAAGLVRSAGRGLEGTARGWAAQSRLVVFLAPGAGDDALARVEKIAADSRLVGDLRRVTPAEARERFSRLYGALAGAAETVGDAAFPPSLEGNLPPSAPEGPRDALLRALAADRAVEEVQWDRDWLERLERAARFVRWGGLALLLLLGTGAALTAAGAMRLALLGAQDEIRVLRLVGATETAIRGPWVVAGALVGLAGSLVALALLAASLGSLSAVLSRELPILPDGALPLPTIGEVVLLAILGLSAATFGGWLASRDTRKIR